MRVALDLDGVVYNFVQAFRDWLDGPDLPEPTRFDFWSEWKMSKEVWLAEFRAGIDAGALFGAGEPYPGAVDGVRRLEARGHTVHVVTSRLNGSAHAVTDTYRWLGRWGVPYETLTFAEDKSVVAADVWVDDSPSVIRRLAEAGKRVLVFDQRWNWDVDVGERVAGWPEALEAL